GAAKFGLPGTVRDQDYRAGELGFYDTYQSATEGLAARALGALRYDFDAKSQTVRVLVYGGYRTLDLFENFTGYLQDPEHGDFRAQHQDGWSFGFSAEHTQILLPSLAL